MKELLALTVGKWLFLHQNHSKKMITSGDDLRLPYVVYSCCIVYLLPFGFIQTYTLSQNPIIATCHADLELTLQQFIQCLPFQIPTIQTNYHQRVIQLCFYIVYQP